MFEGFNMADRDEFLTGQGRPIAGQRSLCSYVTLAISILTGFGGSSCFFHLARILTQAAAREALFGRLVRAAVRECSPGSHFAAGSRIGLSGIVKMKRVSLTVDVTSSVPP